MATYDTWPGVSEGFNGAWGVYPFAASGNIYVSDISSGLYIFRLVDGGPVADFELIAPASQTARAGQTLLFSFDLINRSQTATWYDIVATNNQTWTMSAPDRLRLEGSSSTIITVLLTVPGDIVGVADVHVELCVTSSVTQRTLCKSTDVPTPVVLQGFRARETTDGVALDWQLDLGPSDRGEVVILRANADQPQARSERARLLLGSGEWIDREVRRGDAYVYTIAVDNDAGLSVLGRSTIHLATPGRSRLLGNVPNPFNPATHIQFELAQSADVSLRVYDSRG
ncbi:MAG: hypothetical protein GWN29_11565, partial [Gammaproteobacteria bacterium]|nr:hypothetical protein [Gammaproteobacteria bacterium]